MAVRAACAKFHVNYYSLFQLNQCLTVRKNNNFFSISSSKYDRSVRPKRPFTAYIAYMQTVKDDVKKEYPDLPLVEIAKKIGQLWNNLDASEKEKFKKDYARRKEAYDVQLRLYLETAEDIEEEEVQLKKKMLRKLGKPKNKRSAFNFYTKAMCTGNKAIAFKDAAKMFSQLSPEEKEPYLLEAEHDAHRYLKEIKEWEEEMVETGRSDLLRKAKK